MSTATDAAHLAGSWRADVTHSSIGFAVRHMGISMFRGEVTDFDVLVRTDEGITLSGTGRVASIVTRDDALTAHIGSPDFFDADRHPEIRVQSSPLRIDGDAIASDATLTIKGVYRHVMLKGRLAGPVEDPFGGMRIGLALETTIDRRDFGLDFVMPMPGGGLALGWNVRITAELELVREG